MLQLESLSSKQCSTPLLVPTTLIKKEDPVSLVLGAFFRVITRCV